MAISHMNILLTVVRLFLEAEKDDIVIIAGKGHENYQILHDKTIHFDDKEVALEAIQSHKGE